MKKISHNEMFILRNKINQMIKKIPPENKKRFSSDLFKFLELAAHPNYLEFSDDICELLNEKGLFL